ncbi:MAG TPA: hypothetical protein VFZ98_00785 [Vicinamibacterales bacterium]
MTLRRDFWVTLLDIVVIVSASAALVIMLGGRTRLHFGDTQIGLQSPVNALLISAASAALRFVIGRRLRPLPAIPLPNDDLLALERARIAEPEPVTRRVLWYAVLAGVGSSLWVIPHLVQLRHVTDPGDPVFSAWRIAALAHQLVTDPRHLWNGNIFYPFPYTLTYSDGVVLEALVGAAPVLAGVDPLLVANALTIIAYPARGLAFFLLGWRVTGDPQAALVGALIGACSPFYAEHYPHLELQWTMFVPLALLGLLRVCGSPRWKTGLMFGLAVAAQCLACMYVAVQLLTFLVPFSVCIALAWRPRPLRRVLAAAAAAALVVTPVAAGLGVSYLKSRAIHGDRGLEEVAQGSASPRDYGDAHIRLVTYRWQSGRFHHPERERFPGSTPVALAAVAIAPPLTATAIATLVSGSFAFDWSLGLNGFTYYDLYRRSAVYRGMRVAARFGAIVEAALAILAVYGARRLIGIARTDRTRAAVCGALSVLVLIDLRMDPGLKPYLSTVPDVYRSVGPKMVLAEFPDGHPLDHMYFSTRHWARLLDGYSGFYPPIPELGRAQRDFPSADAVATLRALGATHLTYNCAFAESRDRCVEVFRQLDANPALELVTTQTWESAPVALYRFKQLPPEGARSR